MNERKREMFNITYRLITTAHPFYRKCIKLRRKRIWEPFHLLTSEKFDTEEEKYFTFVAILNSRRVIGCVMLIPEHQNKWMRVCQLAVDEAYCGMGIGSKLMNKVEEYVIKEKYKRMALYAYSDILPFFEKLDFHTYGGWYSHSNRMRSILMIKELR